MSSNAAALDKARKLLALATNEAAAPGEAASAALQLARLIAKHDLLAQPSAPLSFVRDPAPVERVGWRRNAKGNLVSFSGATVFRVAGGFKAVLNTPQGKMYLGPFNTEVEAQIAVEAYS